MSNKNVLCLQAGLAAAAAAVGLGMLMPVPALGAQCLGNQTLSASATTSGGSASVNNLVPGSQGVHFTVSNPIVQSPNTYCQASASSGAAAGIASISLQGLDLSVGNHTVTAVVKPVTGPDWCFTNSQSDCTTNSITYTVAQQSTPVPTVSISATPDIVALGGSSTLTWSSTNASTCTGTGGWNQNLASRGSMGVTPSNTTQYNISCTGSGGTSGTKSVTVNVAAFNLYRAQSSAPFGLVAYANGTWPMESGDWKVADVDGDRRADVIRYLNSKFEVYKTTSATDGTMVKYVTWQLSKESGWDVGDFDGDGRAEIIRYRGDGFDVYRQRDDKTLGDYVRWNVAAGSGWRVGNFNGIDDDGRSRSDLIRYNGEKFEVYVQRSSDRLLNNPWSWSIASGSGGWNLGDFNVDGISDLIRYHNGYFNVYKTSTAGALQEAFAPVPFSTSGSGGWKIGDFNADGRSDLIRYHNGRFDVYRTTTGTFESHATWSMDSGVWQIGDITGDGRWEVIRHIQK